MSVYDNIVCGLKWRGFGNKNIREKVRLVLETVGLSAYKNHNARILSGGEIQRVAIARALAVEPEVLLLDEPTANLDPVSASKLEELIVKIYHEFSTTIVMATHDMSLGQRLAGRIGVLINGEIIQIGSANEIFTTPGTREVAEFIGTANIIDGVITSSEDKVVTVDINGRLVEAISDFTVGEEVAVCVRPEDITLSLSRVSSSARNSFVGQVIHIVTAGPLTRVEVDCGFRLVSLVTKRSAREMVLSKGKQVFAAFKSTGVHVFKRNDAIRKDS
jgi:tungstate transport system ATP-binding protein